jgi:hypothetical protein
MQVLKRRPRGIAFEVYDPWDGQMIVRYGFLWRSEMSISDRDGERIIRDVLDAAARAEGFASYDDSDWSVNLKWGDVFPRTAAEVKEVMVPRYGTAHLRGPDPKLAEYMRQMTDGIAAQHEVKALHLLFFALCYREGGSLTISDEDLERAQRLGPHGVTVTHNAEQGATTITPHRL